MWLFAVAALIYTAQSMPVVSQAQKPELPSYQAGPALKADVPFECGWRALAYEYGRALLPGQATFSSLFDALQLGTLCNQTLAPSSDQSTLQKGSFREMQGTSIFVDFQKGSDRFFSFLLLCPCFRSLSLSLPLSLFSLHSSRSLTFSFLLHYYLFE